jgi:16S rRNA processing protein RimM
MAKPERVPMGRIARPFGVKGEVRMRPYNPRSENLLHLRVLFLRGEQGEEEVEVVQVRPHQDEFLLTLKGFHSRNQVERLRGMEVLARGQDLQPLSEGEYYWHELIGLEVWCEGRRIGRVARMEVTSEELDGADLLVVETEAGEALIPMARTVIQRVDIPGGRIEVHPFEGLWSLGN